MASTPTTWNGRNRPNVELWSTAEVCKWMRQKGHDNFNPIFRQNRVHGQTVLMISPSMLQNVFGIAHSDARQHLLKDLATLQRAHLQLQRAGKGNSYLRLMQQHHHNSISGRSNKVHHQPSSATSSFAQPQIQATVNHTSLYPDNDEDELTLESQHRAWKQFQTASHRLPTTTTTTTATNHNQPSRQINNSPSEHEDIYTEGTINNSHSQMHNNHKSDVVVNDESDVVVNDGYFDPQQSSRPQSVIYNTLAPYQDSNRNSAIYSTIPPLDSNRNSAIYSTIAPSSNRSNPSSNRNSTHPSTLATTTRLSRISQDFAGLEPSSSEDSDADAKNGYVEIHHEGQDTPTRDGYLLKEPPETSANDSELNDSFAKMVMTTDTPRGGIPFTSEPETPRTFDEPSLLRSMRGLGLMTVSMNRRSLTESIGIRFWGGSDLRKKDGTISEITVATVKPGSIASGKLHVGDVLLQINGFNTTNRTHAEVVTLLKPLQGRFDMIVRRTDLEPSSSQHQTDHGGDTAPSHPQDGSQTLHDRISRLDSSGSSKTDKSITVDDLDYNVEEDDANDVGRLQRAHALLDAS